MAVSPGPAEHNWTQLRQAPVPTALLDRGLVSTPSGAGYTRLFTKLHAGEPVTLLAIGSSLVGVHAGCTEPIPALQNCACPACCGARCGGWGAAGKGWARLLLDQLNETYPHPRHRLLNLGEAGGNVLPTLVACPQNYLNVGGGGVDLFLVDFSTTFSAPAYTIEAALRLLLSSGARFSGGRASGGSEWLGPPAVLPVHFSLFVDRKEAASTGQRMLPLLANASFGSTGADAMRRVVDALFPPRTVAHVARAGGGGGLALPAHMQNLRQVRRTGARTPDWPRLRSPAAARVPAPISG